MGWAEKQSRASTDRAPSPPADTEGGDLYNEARQNRVRRLAATAAEERPMIPNAWVGFDFGLGPDVDALRDSVSRFAQDKIAPRAEEIDRTNKFPRELWPQLGGLGLLGITVEEEWGGAGLGYLEHCVAMEEVSRASAAIGLSYGEAGLSDGPLARCGVRR